MGSNTRSVNKLFVLIFIIGLFAQLQFVGARDEPYPLILFPGGGGVIENSEVIAYSRYQFVARSFDGKEEKVNQFNLFYTVPTGYSHHVIRNILNLNNRQYDDSNDREKGKIWFRQKLKRITSLNQVSELKIKNASYNLYLSNNKLDSIRTKRILKIATLDLSENE